MHTSTPRTDRPIAATVLLAAAEVAYGMEVRP